MAQAPTQQDDHASLHNMPTPEAPRSRMRPLPLLGLLVLLAAGITVGIHYWHYATTHVSTDDAFLTADITQIAPEASGTVTRVLVEENQRVHAGDELVELDDSSYRAAVEQAQANLDAAIAQAKAAGIAVTLAQETGDAQVSQAQGGVDQGQSGITSATADFNRATAAVDKANSAAKASVSNITTAQAGLAAAQANVERAKDAVDAALAQVTTAQANEKAAEAAVSAAQATADKSARDVERYTALFSKGAVSKQQVDQVTSNARVTQAQLESACEQARMAKATVDAREADVRSARQQVEAANAAVAQARAQILSAGDMADTAQADVRQAQAQRLVAQQAIRQAEAKHNQAVAQLQQAKTAPVQVKMNDSNHAQALAKIEQARAALTAAQIQLAHTRITAPVDGVISKRTVEVGALVQPGTPLMALVQSDRLWVVANFKETQLAHVRAGESVNISVDALDDEAFHGIVDSISAGTGATFALLPPDNATGNFTKVVQRIPIKIRLNPHQHDVDRLRAGLSANVVVATR
ncbi:MAG TPA: HlyD family secretion protein [Armatimonadota bacterium]|nr:HlyD family secretion protein [Armatimonadota bacterium]